MSRPATPLSVLKLRGTYRPDRHMKREAAGDLPTARCPQWLDPSARKVWRRLGPGLTRLGLLTSLDGPLFAVWCVTYARWQAALKTLDAEGPIYYHGGLKKTSPLVTIVDGLAKQLLALSSQFGLSPVARAKLNVDLSSGEDSPLTEYLKNRHRKPDQG